MSLAPHLYDPHGWIELDPATRQDHVLGGGKDTRVDVRHRNDIITQDRRHEDLDWTDHSPPRPYDIVAWRLAR